MARAPVAVLGIFVADLAFRAPRLPLMGEGTLVGTQLTSATPFAMIFLACAAMLVASLVTFGLMPEKPLRGSDKTEAPILVE